MAEVWWIYHHSLDAIAQEPSSSGLAEVGLVQVVEISDGGPDFAHVVLAPMKLSPAVCFLLFAPASYGEEAKPSGKAVLFTEDFEIEARFVADRLNGDDWFGSWIEYSADTHRPSAYTYYHGMYQDCADPNGRCWGDIFPAKTEGYTAGKPQHQPRVQPPLLEAGRWYCIEMMLDGGNPTATGERGNGTLNFWIDGMEIGPWTDLWLRSTDKLKLGILWLSLFHHDGKHSEEGILIDDVAISTEQIGP